MKVGFAGMSHLGIVSSIATAAKGFEVIGFDSNEERILSLNGGSDLPIHEPGLVELLSQHRTKISFSSNPNCLSSCDVVYISLDVATDSENRSDLGPVRNLVNRVAPLCQPHSTLVILSQVTPGLTRSIQKSFSENQIYYQVETLIFGRAVERALSPERVILGCQDPLQPLPSAFSTVLKAFGCPLLPMKYESAELAKLSINFCLVSSLSVASTLSELCEKIGADWSEIVPALKLDKRIGPNAYLTPGLGIAGGNLERDLATVLDLSQNFGTDSQVVSSWIRNFEHRRNWALLTLHQQVLSKVDHPKLAQWGIAYKENTHSIKNSPAVSLLNSLKSFSVSVYDPEARLSNELEQTSIHSAASALEALKGADVLTIMTPWPEFAKVSVREIRDRMAGKIVIDPFGVLNSVDAKREGLEIHRLGKT